MSNELIKPLVSEIRYILDTARRNLQNMRAFYLNYENASQWLANWEFVIKADLELRNLIGERKSDILFSIHNNLKLCIESWYVYE